VLFSRAGAGEIEACLATMRARRFRRDETVFHQGDPGDALYIIASGSVKIVLPPPDAGESAFLATLGAGEFFGELALLDGEPHSASVIAMEPTEVLVLGRDDFEPLLASHPDLQRALMAGLSHELRRLTGHVEALHFLDLPQRLAARIAELAAPSEAAGDAAAAEGEVRLDWPWTQAELAGMVGGSRESVNRHLASFAARGLLRFERDALVVPDVARLAAEARR
jgi:CRP/FNR family transcriptional regulator